MLLLAALTAAGCSTANSMLGGNSSKEAMAQVSWDYARDAVMVEVNAAPDLNAYGGESHTLLLGVYQMAEADAFHKLLADPAALAKTLESGKAGDGFALFGRYVVKPGQHSILVLDRAQKARYVGIVGAYYAMTPEGAARLFEIPLTLTSEGLVAKTYHATPAVLAVRLHLGSENIVNAQRLNSYPAEKRVLEAVPLDGGGKEIKLTPEEIKNAINLGNTLQELKN